MPAICIESGAYLYILEGKCIQSGVHAAVAHVIALFHQARDQDSRHLVFVTGVPGAGKTLVGLQLAHSAALEEGFRVGKWFNDGPQSARSCCHLDTVITEFQCQGLELDLP
ncbi:MAG: DNA/RNA helicase domain-containing protein, partial [Thermoanaerobaculia bacterium]